MMGGETRYSSVESWISLGTCLTGSGLVQARYGSDVRDAEENTPYWFCLERATGYSFKMNTHVRSREKRISMIVGASA
jgi:hypothetical protein